MQYRLIDHGTDAYEQSLRLRHDLLRVPLGMDLYDGSYDDLSQEHRYYHFGAFDEEGKLVASILGIPNSPSEVRLKQMVVSKVQQKKGIGKRLFLAFEAYLLNLGFKVFILHARKAAYGFYLNMGYEIIGDEFEEVGIPHYKMSKKFISTSD
ncbi:MAG: GNAT family N-acetyltransferase [Candidatus Marinimicrobia bacterium]|nr:GNAT family N-acetyltransferase [Candidatus Neomarinimicrobiota bacterium]